MRFGNLLKLAVLVLSLGASAVSQVVPTKIRSVTSLPATCRQGNGIIPADVVVYVTGGVSTLMICRVTNTWVESWGGGTFASPTLTGTVTLPGGTTVTSPGTHQTDVLYPGTNGLVFLGSATSDGGSLLLGSNGGPIVDLQALSGGTGGLLQILTTSQVFLGHTFTNGMVGLSDAAGSSGLAIDGGTGVVYTDSIINSGEIKSRDFFATPVSFSTLPSCTSGGNGLLYALTDGSTNIVGTTVAGGGSNHVMAYCNGTNWVVGPGGVSAGGGGGFSDPCPDVNAETNIYIDPAGNDSTGDGSIGNPYQHIGRGLEDIPVIVCHPYRIVLKSVGTYGMRGGEATYDISGKIYYSGGIGLNDGQSDPESSWPYHSWDPGFNYVRGNWITVVGTPTADNDDGTPGGPDNPNSYIVNGPGACGGGVAFNVGNGYLTLMGLSIRHSGVGVIANHSVVEFAGITFVDNCTHFELDNHSTLWLDGNNDGENWNDNDTGLDTYFKTGETGTAGGHNFDFIMTDSRITDQPSLTSSSTHSEVIELGGQDAGVFANSSRFLMLGHSSIELGGYIDTSGIQLVQAILDEDSSIKAFFNYDGTAHHTATGTASTDTAINLYDNSTISGGNPRGTGPSITDTGVGVFMERGGQIIDTPSFTSVVLPYQFGLPELATPSKAIALDGTSFHNGNVSPVDFFGSTNHGSRAGMYRVCATVEANGVDTGNVAAKVVYTVDSVPGVTATIATVSFASIGVVGEGCKIIIPDDNTTVQYETVNTGNGGTPQYLLQFSVEVIQ